jgi:hypothetical protein
LQRDKPLLTSKNRSVKFCAAIDAPTLTSHSQVKVTLQTISPPFRLPPFAVAFSATHFPPPPPFIPWPLHFSGGSPAGNWIAGPASSLPSSFRLSSTSIFPFFPPFALPHFGWPPPPLFPNSRPPPPFPASFVGSR